MPYALIAPITSVPSSPRLMRPERSVMHSPRLTNKNGVETRMAPPNTASGTVQSPIVPSAISRFSFQETDASIQRVAGEYEHEDDPLQHQDRCIGQSEPALQQAAAGADAAKQDCDGNDGQRIVPRQEGDEDAGEAVTGREVGVGAALNGSDLDHAGQPGGAACKKTNGQDQFADAESDDFGSTDVATRDPRREAEHGVIDQDVGGKRCDQAEHQPPMHIGAWNAADHVGGADFAGRRLVEAGRIAHRALDQMVED